MEPTLWNKGAPAPASSRAERTASDEAGLWSLALALLEPEPTFAVHDEGAGVFSLYVTPLRPRTLARALRRLHLAGPLLDVTPRWGVRQATPLDLGALAGRTSPLDLVVGAGDPPRSPVLADPHGALAGRSLAVSLHDDHGVVYSRDRDVLRDILGTWLAEQIAVQAPTGSCPQIPPSALVGVSAPLPAEAFRRVELEEQPRVWRLDLDACVTDDSGDDVVIDPIRWVGGPDRAWRSGWSW